MSILRAFSFDEFFSMEEVYPVALEYPENSVKYFAIVQTNFLNARRKLDAILRFCLFCLRVG